MHLFLIAIQIDVCWFSTKIEHQIWRKWIGSSVGQSRRERKLSSPKSSKPKRVPSEKSPVLEAFIKGVKEHHRDRGIHEAMSGLVCHWTPNIQRQLQNTSPSFISLVKRDQEKHQSPEGRKSHFIHENSREKNDGNRGRISADSKKQVTVTEADIFKNSSRSLSSRSSLSRHHPGESPLGPKFSHILSFLLQRKRTKEIEKGANGEWENQPRKIFLRSKQSFQNLLV